jgi:hypothetical protein
MKERAIEYFHGAERDNCAQAVHRSLNKFNRDQAHTICELAGAGGGRAPGGLCGALYAAKQVLPEDRKAELRAYFEKHAGAVHCREIRRASRMSCRECVAAAAGYVEEHLDV